MAITAQLPRNVSTAAPGAKDFPYNFKVFDKSELLVQVDGATKTIDVDFTADGIGNDGGGSIHFVAAMVGGETVMRKRNMQFQRLTDYQGLGDLRSPTLNNDQDSPIAMIQQLYEVQLRSLQLPLASTMTAELPDPVALAPLVISADKSRIEMGDPNMTGDMLLRPALASDDETKGSQLVTFKRSGIAAALPVALATWIGTTWNLIECIPSAQRAAVLNYTSTFDATTYINNFLAAAASQGVNVYAPPGLFCHAGSIQFGNPPANNPSTINGIRFVGGGVGRNADTMNANDAPTIFRYIGAGGGTCMKIAGPISGVHLEGFLIDGNNLAATILDTQRSFHQTVRSVTGVRWTNGYGLTINASTPLGPTYGGAAPIDHLYEQFNLKAPGVGANSLDIGNGSGNINQVAFVRCYLDRYNTTTTIGARLGYCDHVQFIGSHLAQTGASGSTGIAIQVRPQVGQGAFPTNITFTGTSLAGGVAYDSSLQAWAGGSFPALIFQPFYTADGAPVPPKSANGGTDLPAGMARGWTDNGIEFGWWGEDQEIVNAAATIAPRKKTIILTGTSTTISTITPPRAVFSVALGGYRLTVIPSGNGMKFDTAGNIAEKFDLANYRAIELVYSEGTGKWHVESGLQANDSGVWTPTLTNTTNVSASTPREFKWLRIGNTVHFSGRIEVTPAAAADTLTVVDITLPTGLVPANFNNTWDAAGTATVAFTPYRPGLIIGQGTSIKAQFHSAGTASVGVIVTGSYKLA